MPRIFLCFALVLAVSADAFAFEVHVPAFEAATFELRALDLDFDVACIFEEPLDLSVGPQAEAAVAAAESVEPSVRENFSADRLCDSSVAWDVRVKSRTFYVG